VQDADDKEIGDVQMVQKGMSRRQLAAASLAAAVAVTGSSAKATPKSDGKLAIEDRLALDDLMTAFVWSYDCTDKAGFLDLYTDDAVVIGITQSMSGKAAMGKWFDYLIDLREKEGDTWFHLATHHHFEGAAPIVRIWSYTPHFRWKLETKEMGIRSLGILTSECIKERGIWKFRRFAVSHLDKSALPWKRPLPWAGFKA
jgi:hypothetical protein